MLLVLVCCSALAMAIRVRTDDGLPIASADLAGDAPFVDLLQVLWEIEREPRGSVRGVVVDERGSPVRGARIDLIPLNPELDQGSVENALGLTNARGEYALNRVTLGQYVVAINRESAPTGDVPILGAYYPGVDERRAEPVSVRAFDTRQLRPVRVRRLQTTTVLVNVMFEDGTRPARSHLSFRNRQFLYQGVIPELDDGRGTLTLPIGFEYEAQASVVCEGRSIHESRESRPVKHINVFRRTPHPDELTFVIPGKSCKLWSPR